MGAPSPAAARGASKLERARRVAGQRKESGEHSIHDEGLPELLSKLENRPRFGTEPSRATSKYTGWYDDESGF